MNIPEKLVGPEWASGCPDCKFGIVLAPDIVPTLPLYEGRAVQCGEDMIVFCDCRAGFMYRQCLRKIYDAMNMATKRNLREHVLAASTPTVHAATPPPAPAAHATRQEVAR